MIVLWLAVLLKRCASDELWLQRLVRDGCTGAVIACRTEIAVSETKDKLYCVVPLTHTAHAAAAASACWACEMS